MSTMNAGLLSELASKVKRPAPSAATLATPAPKEKDSGPSNGKVELPAAGDRDKSAQKPEIVSASVQEKVEEAHDSGGEQPMELDSDDESSPNNEAPTNESSPAVRPSSTTPGDVDIPAVEKSPEKVIPTEVLIPKPKRETVVPWFLRPAEEVEEERRRIEEEERLKLEEQRRLEEEAETEKNGVEDSEDVDDSASSGQQSAAAVVTANDNEYNPASPTETDDEDELDFGRRMLEGSPLRGTAKKPAPSLIGQPTAVLRQASSSPVPSSSVPAPVQTVSESHPSPPAAVKQPPKEEDDADVWDLLENI